MVPSRPQNRIIGEISLLYIWILRGSKMEFPFKMVPFFRGHVHFAGGGVGVIPSQLEPFCKNSHLGQRPSRVVRHLIGIIIGLPRQGTFRVISDIH